MRPNEQTYPVYYQKYISLVKEDKVIEALTNNLESIKTIISNIPLLKEDFAYAEGKWTVKQVVQHTIDTERILAYRALRFARNDSQQPLPFDENAYAANSNVDAKKLSEIFEELQHVRLATISLYRSFNQEALLKMGYVASGQVSVVAIGFFICGHTLHHLNVVKERYL
ncbi:MAG: DinB family protein [Bacteroidota bacterium]|nr:DinB family protein [Bacteroidota bacterium]